MKRQIPPTKKKHSVTEEVRGPERATETKKERPRRSEREKKETK